MLWTKCGKCCDHSAKILKVTADADPTFDPQDYNSLRDIDYFHSTSEFLEYIYQGRFTTGFAINLTQASASSSTPISNPNSSPYPSEYASTMTFLMLLSSTCTSGDRSRLLLDISIINSESTPQFSTESPIQIWRPMLP